MKHVLEFNSSMCYNKIKHSQKEKQMNTEKLNKWADLLLDTGKRNNLIHFKDTKMSTAEILFPDYATLFERTESAATFEVFDPKLENEESEEEKENEEDEDRLSKEEYLKKYGSRLKKNQILLYNTCNKPISAIKNINKKAKSAIEETGVNIAYIAFGFVNWTENENSQYVMKAPVLLSPIKIENQSAVDPYFIKTDDEIIVNPTFSFKLQNDYGIKLPDYNEDEGIYAYFDEIGSLVSKLKWSVTTECKIGIFSFLKINMYKDLKDNAEKIIQNENIRTLLGDTEIQSNSADSETPSFDLLDLHNVVDADSSQAEAIESAKFGRSFVLQGPPGTGKSQTITNIIAECLLDRKKVLFVSEKLAALNVVYEKLKSAGLEEFCLELHSHKANKKQVINELCHTLKMQKSGLSEQAESELRVRKESQKILDTYAVELHKIRPVINKTLYQLYEAASAYRNAPDFEFLIQSISAKGQEYLNQAENLLSRYTEYIPSVGKDYHLNIWYGYKDLDCSYQSVLQLKNDLLAVGEICKMLAGIAKTLKEKYDMALNDLSCAHVYHRFFTLLKDSGFITPAFLDYQVLARSLDVVLQMQELSKEISAHKTFLDESFDADIYNIDGKTIYKKLIKQFQGVFFRLFSREYKQILTQLTLCKKDGKKPKYKAERILPIISWP